MRNTKNPAPAKRGQPRRRVVPLWRSRWAAAAALAVMLGSGAAGGWWLWQSGWVARSAEQFKWNLIALSGELGFKVEEILVVGRNQTTQDALLKAVRLARGAPILAYDLDAAKRRVESLPWVYSASVERMLPATVLLRVVERTPLALWQNKGRFALIDRDGVVILDSGIERFSDLLVVVGEGAPAHAGDLLEILETQPRLMNQVKAAVWVGGRRWNVRLDNGIDVRLPEKNPASAWARLAEYDRTHRVLERDVKILDLRLPDRLIVRMPERPDKFEAGPGRDT